MLVNYLIYTLEKFIESNVQMLDNVIEVGVVRSNDYNPDLPKSAYVILDSITDWKNIYLNANSDEYTAVVLLKDSTTNNSAYLNVLTHFMNMFIGFTGYMDQFKLVREKFDIPFNIVKCTMYIIGWSYLLLYGISFI